MEKVKVYAPVIIPTLCRYEHFKRCVESLSKCTHASETDLFIGLDYPINNSHWEGYMKINTYISKGISGFKKVNIIKREQNYGANRNLVELEKEVFEKYDRLILSEDDNEFSPNFLDYINKGLELYEDDIDIISISGYSYLFPFLECEEKVYLYSAFSAWGVGLWRDKYMPLKKDFITNDFASSILKSFKNSYYLLNSRSRILSALISMVKKETFYCDTIFETYLILNDKYSIFPSESKVRNWGHDGSGIHCGDNKNEIYSTQIIDSQTTFPIDYFQKKTNYNYSRKLDKYNTQSIIAKTKVFIKYLLYKISYKFAINK